MSTRRKAVAAAAMVGSVVAIGLTGGADNAVEKTPPAAAVRICPVGEVPIQKQGPHTRCGPIPDAGVTP